MSLSSTVNQTQIPHRRFNPLTGEWLLVSPQRSTRPWRGQEETPETPTTVPYDPTCFLCAGNTRSSGKVNPCYQGTYVFDNDIPALLPHSNSSGGSSYDLLTSEPVYGLCRVICYSEHHSHGIAHFSLDQLEGVIQTWMRELTSLSQQHAWVQIFENKGAMMGCSSPHPHGQIWATSALPNEAEKETRAQQKYFANNERTLLFDYAKLELSLGERVVLEEDHWIVVVPYWAAWPFETLLLPKQRVIPHLDDLSKTEQRSLAITLKKLTTRYDNLFATECPYTMGWHGAPAHSPKQGWQLHAHFYPPLLRSATVKKFMVGYEMLAEPQRDITPEQAALQLRLLSDIHYSGRTS